MGLLHSIGYWASTIGVGYVGGIAALRAMQDRLLLHPKRKSPDMGTVADCQVTDWLPGGRYAGLVVEPQGAVVSTSTVLIFHGNAGTAEGRLPLAARFAQSGYRVVIAEYPGFGRREGELSLDNALSACKEAFQQVTQTWAGSVLLCGESLGAGMAGQVLLGNEECVCGVVLATPWDSLTAVAQAKLPFVPVRRLLRHSFDTAKTLQRYQGPVVVIAAKQDRLIPVGHARMLARSTRSDLLLEIERAGHDDWFKSMSGAEWDAVLKGLQAGG